MPLDIHLDLMDAEVPSWWRYAAEKLVPVSDAEVSGDGDDGEGDLRLKMVRQWAEIEADAYTFSLVKYYAHLLEQHLEALTGRMGEVARRWSSFTVLLDPTINAVPLLFPRYPTPLLESFGPSHAMEAVSCGRQSLSSRNAAS
jgi:hypothetical protein